MSSFAPSSAGRSSSSRPRLPRRLLTLALGAAALLVTAGAALGCQSFAEAVAEAAEEAADSSQVAAGHQPWNASLRFDDGDYVEMGRMDLSGTDLTIEAWVRPTRFPNTIHTIAGIEASGEATALLRVGDVGLAEDHPQFVLRVGGAQAKLNADEALSTGEWQHVAATYDGRRMRLYIDGDLVAARDQSGPVEAEEVFRVGRSFGGRYFYGRIDEVRVWKTRRSGGDLSTAMNVLLDARDWPLLVGYWPFDDGSGRRATEYSTRALDGRIRDAAWADTGAPVEKADE